MAQALVLVTQRLTERFNTLEADTKSRSGSGSLSGTTPAFSPAASLQLSRMSKDLAEVSPHSSANAGGHSVQFELAQHSSGGSSARQASARAANVASAAASASPPVLSPARAGSVLGAPVTRGGSVAGSVVGADSGSGGMSRPKSARELLVESALAEREAAKRAEMRLKSDEERIKAQRAAIAARRDGGHTRSESGLPPTPPDAGPSPSAHAEARSSPSHRPRTAVALPGTSGAEGGGQGGWADRGSQMSASGPMVPHAPAVRNSPNRVALRRTTTDVGAAPERSPPASVNFNAVHAPYSPVSDMKSIQAKLNTTMEVEVADESYAPLSAYTPPTDLLAALSSPAQPRHARGGSSSSTTGDAPPKRSDSGGASRPGSGVSSMGMPPAPGRSQGGLPSTLGGSSGGSRIGALSMDSRGSPNLAMQSQLGYNTSASQLSMGGVASPPMMVTSPGLSGPQMMGGMAGSPQMMSNAQMMGGMMGGPQMMAYQQQQQAMMMQRAQSAQRPARPHSRRPSMSDEAHLRRL